MAEITTLAEAACPVRSEGSRAVLTSVHPGVTVEEVQALTGRDLRIAGPLSVTPAPTGAELGARRATRADMER